MNKEEALRKIVKIMAIAGDPSASDQEMQLASYRARKLMIEYKITEFELYGKQEQKNVEVADLKGQSSGYFIWVLKELAQSFRCKASYKGKVNTNKCEFRLWGLPNDIQLCLPIAEGLLFYLNNMLHDLQNCYVGSEDFRIFKREYYRGFKAGLSESLDKAYLEMHVDKKYEIAILGVPALVEETYANKVLTVKSKFLASINDDGYILGKKHGTEYDIARKDLIAYS